MLNIGHLGKAALESEHLMQKIGWQMVNLPHEVRNAFMNHVLLECGNDPSGIDTIVRLLDRLKAIPHRVRCMSEIPRVSGEPIICIGSGSSLDPIVPHLKDWPHPIMCSTSQASTLIYHGRHPEYMICMDPRTAAVDRELDAPDWGNTAMITHPSIPFPYVTRWLLRSNNPMYVSRIMEPTYDWYSHHLGQGYPWIRHVILPMIDSVAAEVGFATWMGYNPIYLLGVDYGGPRMQRWDWNYDAKQWAPDKVTSGYVAQHEGDFSGLTASQAMSYSSRGALLSTFMQIANPRYKQRIYQLSSVSALNQFPYMKWEDVMATRGERPEGGWDKQMRENIQENIEAALAAWDTFLVPIPGGWGLDYHTYVAKDEENYAKAMLGYNRQVENNLKNFAALEEQYKRPVLDMIRDGWISIEAGELLLKGADEFQDWDWKRIGPIDIGYCLQRRRHLLKLAKERGYEKPSATGKQDLPINIQKPEDVLAPTEIEDIKKHDSTQSG